MRSDAPRQPLGEFLRGWPLRAGLLVLVVAGVGVAFYVAARRGGPDERNRVRHPVGYSIVPPRDCDVKVVVRTGNPDELDLLSFEPKNWQGLKPSLWVKRLAGPPLDGKLRENGFIDGTFQGQPALICLEKKKRSAQQRVIFHRGSMWFEVGVDLPGVEMTRLSEWWQFAETFRAPAELSPSPTHVDGSTSSTSMR